MIQKVFRAKLTVLVLFFIFSGGYFVYLSGCGSGGGDFCEKSADCQKGFRCVRSRCIKYTVRNKPPVAQIKAPRDARINEKVELDGSASSDPEGKALKYIWGFLETPAGAAPRLSDPNGQKTSFTPKVSGLYVVQLVVVDPQGARSIPARAAIRVYGEDQNRPPAADAGEDRIVPLAKEVVLDGTKSSDPDGDKLTFKWLLISKPAGSKAVLSNPTSEKPSFIPDLEGKYVIELTVNDGIEDSLPDEVVITALSDFDLEPKLTSISPTEGFPHTVIKMKVQGQGFSRNAVLWVSTNRVSKKRIRWKSDSLLEAIVDLGGLTPGKYDIKVENPNGKKSNALEFTVFKVPEPSLISMDPSLAMSGGRYEITLKGKGFTPHSEVQFHLVPLKTKYISPTELKFQLDLSRTPKGEYDVKVRNPGGKYSNKLKFKVIDPGPPPVLRVLNPPSGRVGEKLKFSVHGIGFAVGAKVYFGGKELPSKRIRRDEIQIVPYLDLTNVKPGFYSVWVKNPDGQVSNKEKFEVEEKDPAPILSRILPFFIYINTENTLSVYGRRFRKGLKLRIGNVEIKGNDIDYKGPTFFKAKVDTRKGSWTAGDVYAQVVNPNGKASQKFKLTITHFVPSISSITPSGWNHKCDTDVHIYGSNFIKTAEVHLLRKLSYRPPRYSLVYKYTVNSTIPSRKLTYIDSKHLKLRLEASKLSYSSYGYAFEVVNGPSAKSGPQDFPIRNSSLVKKPIIGSVSPSAGRANTTPTVTLRYSGSNRFEVGAVVYFDNKQQKTTCSGTSYCYSLTAELNLLGYKPGYYDIHVENPCGIKSDPVKFYVSEPPRPYLTKISPAFARVGESKTITIFGKYISQNTKLYWGGKVVDVKFKSPDQLITKNPISFANSQPNTEIDVYLDNGFNQRSSTLKFPILPASQKLIISSISPELFDSGKLYNGISIRGDGFSKNSEIYFNGKKVTAKFVSSQNLIADNVSFANLSPGPHYFQVKDGSSKSNRYPVFVKSLPLPVLTRISPTTVFTSSPTISMYVYGQNFCKLASSTTCAHNPIVKIYDSNKKDVSSAFTFTRYYISRYSGWGYAYVYGILNLSTLKAGSYLIYLTLPTGEKSNPGLLVVKNPPPPAISRLDPSTYPAGRSFKLKIYGKDFCPTSLSRCRINPDVIITGPPNNTDYGTKGKKKFKVTYTYLSRYSSFSRVEGYLDASAMPAGIYKVQLQHPVSKQLSNPLTLVLTDPPPPAIHSISPYYATINTRRTFTLSGSGITRGAYLAIGIKTFPLIVTSSSSGSFLLDTYNIPAGTYTITLVNPNGKRSLPYGFQVIDPAKKKPFISNFRPHPLDYDKKYSSLTIYGYNWPKGTNADILLDGKSAPRSSISCFYGSTYQNCSLRNFSTQGLKPGKHTFQYKVVVSGKTVTTDPFPFYIPSPPAPKILSVSPSTLKANSTVSVTITGSNFINGAYVTVGINTYPAIFVSSSKLTALIDTRKLKKGTHQLIVVNPDQQKSNPFTITVQ